MTAAVPPPGLRDKLVEALMHHAWCWIERGQCTCEINRREDADRLVPVVQAAIDTAVAQALAEAADELCGWRDNARRYEAHATDERRRDLADQAHLAYRRAVDCLRARAAARGGQP